MITKKYNKVVTGVISSLLFPLSSLLLSGCSDFLDILPMNSTVLENYWKEKADVTSAVNGCYAALASEDVVTRMGVWGELRSENVVAGTNVPNNLNEMLKENLLPTNEMCTWACFYNVINLCNIVCHYAPEVESIDPNYTSNELKGNIAEMKTLRALCYFYLIRTFRDVPYVTEPSIDDSQNYVVPATPFEAVLDSLITDLESVKDDAQRRFSLEKVEGKSIYVPAENNSRITRWAIYSLLADFYLWKGDWNNVIKYCDLVINYKAQQYKELLETDQITDIDLYDGIPLILEAIRGEQNVGHAYTSVFGDGNSFESIFELYYNGSNGQENTWVSSYYGDNNNTLGRLSAPDFLFKDVALGTNNVFKRTDGRAYESSELTNSRYTISKYTRRQVNYSTQNVASEKDLQLSSSRRSSSDANWILYRLSDMILIKAEALIERNNEGDLAEAFALIDIVNKRANDAVGGTRSSTLKKEDYIDSKPAMEDLLLEERQREFVFEGKRWFDLVRFARRDGDNSRLISLASRKYIENVNAIKIKLADPNIIYFPYAKNELKVNPLLQQNPAFTTGEDSELTR